MAACDCTNFAARVALGVECGIRYPQAAAKSSLESAMNIRSLAQQASLPLFALALTACGFGDNSTTAGRSTPAADLVLKAETVLPPASRSVR